MAKSPNGLSGPGGTTLGKKPPAAALSAIMEAGGYQDGFFCLEVTFVLPRGVFQSTRPILIG